MSGYPAATIGKAFETSFRDSHWDSAVTSEGVRVVNFTGTLPANLRQDCVAAKEGLVSLQDCESNLPMDLRPRQPLLSPELRRPGALARRLPLDARHAAVHLRVDE